MTDTVAHTLRFPMNRRLRCQRCHTFCAFPRYVAVAHTGYKHKRHKQPREGNVHGAGGVTSQDVKLRV